MYTCIHQKPTGGNQVYNVYKFVHLAKVINLIKVSQLMPGIYTVKKIDSFPQRPRAITLKPNYASKYIATWIWYAC